MAESSSDYHRGEMDIHAQAETYHGFLKGTKWGSLAVAVAVLVLTLWFCTPSGFFGGLVGGAILTVIGIAILREKPGAPSH